MASEWSGDPLESPGEHACHWHSVSLKSKRTGGLDYAHCTRPYADQVSAGVRRHGVWPDCLALLTLWRSSAKPKEAATSSSSDIFIDAGANIGSCTLYMAAHGVPTVAFEPSPANLFYLTRSLAANPQLRRHVTLYPVGLSDAAATFPMYVERGNAGNSVLRRPIHANATAAHVVGVVTLDRAMERALHLASSTSSVEGPPPWIRLLKVDTQGFELRVLRGARRLLAAARVGCVKFELAPDWLHGQNATERQLYAEFERHGYSVHRAHGGRQLSRQHGSSQPLELHMELQRVREDEFHVRRGGAVEDFVALAPSTAAAAAWKRQVSFRSFRHATGTQME